MLVVGIPFVEKTGLRRRTFITKHGLLDVELRSDCLDRGIGWQDGFFSGRKNIDLDLAGHLQGVVKPERLGRGPPTGEYSVVVHQLQVFVAKIRGLMLGRLRRFKDKRMVG